MTQDQKKTPIPYQVMVGSGLYFLLAWAIREYHPIFEAPFWTDLVGILPYCGGAALIYQLPLFTEVRSIFSDYVRTISLWHIALALLLCGCLLAWISYVVAFAITYDIELNYFGLGRETLFGAVFAYFAILVKSAIHTIMLFLPLMVLRKPVLSQHGRGRYFLVLVGFAAIYSIQSFGGGLLSSLLGQGPIKAAAFIAVVVAVNLLFVLFVYFVVRQRSIWTPFLVHFFVSVWVFTNAVIPSSHMLALYSCAFQSIVTPGQCLS